VEISLADRTAWHDTLVSLYEMIEVSHAVVMTASQIEDQIAQVRETLATRTEVPENIELQLETVENKVKAILETMLGDDTDAGATQPGAPPLSSRVRRLYSAVGASVASPTVEQMRLTSLSSEQLAEHVEAINMLLEEEVAELREDLDRAGVPWSLGRLVAPPRR
jgi:hypothetical protein